MADFAERMFEAGSDGGSAFVEAEFFEEHDFLTPAPQDPVRDEPTRPGAPRGSSVCSGESAPPARDAQARYVPPYKREQKMETGDAVAMPALEKKGDEQGVDNRHFGRLIIYCMIALTKATILALNSRFPGCFFQSKDVVNHDHPVAHVVTQVGTNFLQRMIKSGSKILDVYGNPKACNAFNRKQLRRNNPKSMDAICQRFSEPDFIREINKWGPMVEEDNDGTEKLNWDFTTIDDMSSERLSSYSIFQCIHTLYYLSVADIMKLVHSSPGSKILGLIHTHTKAHGFINDGEQEYWVKGGVVKQRNVKTNTVYYHPNITPLFFSETKTVYPWAGMEGHSTLGFTWECHFVCEDTWIIEIAACDKAAMLHDPAKDYKRMFEEAEMVEQGIKLRHHREPVAVPDLLPTKDGKWVELQTPNRELVDKLRLVAAGKKRTGKEGQKLMVELIQTAKHLVNPGALFPDAAKMAVDVGRIGDYVIAAFVADVPHETSLYAAVDLLEPVLLAHTTARSGKPIGKMSTLGMIQAFRGAVSVTRMVNKTVRSKDVLDSAMGNLEDALDDTTWGL